MATQGGSGLSSNPALAAIQRAKLEQQKSLQQQKSTQSRMSLEFRRPSMEHSPTLSSALSVGSPPSTFQADQRKRLTEENETSMLREGWWAKTDAGNMNIIDEDKKVTNSIPSALPAGTMSSKKLDFSSMFNRAPSGDGQGSPAPTAFGAATATAPIGIPGATLEPLVPTLSPSSLARSFDRMASLSKVTDGVATLLGSPSGRRPTGSVEAEGGAAGWWTKMDDLGLNRADEREDKATQPSAFQPQFMGGLTTKLDYTRPPAEQAM